MLGPVLAGYDKALRSDHISIVDATQCHGMLFSARQKLDEAGQMLRPVLDGYDKALRSDHISIASVIKCYEMLFSTRRKLDGAE
ncbi:unnamed protein product [Penicillium camemberti]|uniref:Str. FM013 n=1 Tax=Penicillium camemberti (strain FM 013) TaxID=1429867 RepID=A0A0G4PXH3_PENC3|nr:unnamed protein product [Penicillium camemberti]